MMPGADHNQPPVPANALAAIAATDEGRMAVARAMIGKLRAMVHDESQAPKLAEAVRKIMRG